MTGSYTGSNRTWKTYLHILFCLSSKFSCSVFVSFEISLWKGLGTETDKQKWWKTFQEVFLVHLPKIHNCSSHWIKYSKKKSLLINSSICLLSSAVDWKWQSTKMKPLNTSLMSISQVSFMSRSLTVSEISWVQNLF